MQVHINKSVEHINLYLKMDLLVTENYAAKLKWCSYCQSFNPALNLTNRPKPTFSLFNSHMNELDQQRHAKIAHRDRVLQVFENDKQLITPGHDNIVDMYRVTLRVWRKLRVIDEAKFDNAKNQLTKEDAFLDKAHKEHIEPLDLKMAHIDSLLRFLRYCSYPIYPGHPDLIPLDSAAKRRHEKLRILRARTNSNISKALKAQYPHNNLTLYLGEDENGVLTFFDTPEEANEALEKFKNRRSKLTIVQTKTTEGQPNDGSN